MSKSIYDLSSDMRSKLYYASSHLSSCAVIADISITSDCIPIHEAEVKVHEALDAAQSLLSLVQEIVRDPEY